MNYKSFNFKKKFGQNFLIDKNIVNNIVNYIPLKKDSLVIEIGCGDGKLTSKLCEMFDFVIGYEIDLDVKNRLLYNLDKYSNYELIFDDFMNRNFLEDINRYNYSHIYVVANLPYYITTPIIEKLINSNIKFEYMSFMVQKEVADRFSALVGTKNYSSISVYLNYKYDVKKLFIVSRNSFYPVPKVDSAIISFSPKKELYKVDNELLFFKLVKDSFKYKRKNLRNNLKDYDLEKVLFILKKYNFDLSVRAEQLSINIFCDIANYLNI